MLALQAIREQLLVNCNRVAHSSLLVSKPRVAQTLWELDGLSQLVINVQSARTSVMQVTLHHHQSVHASPSFLPFLIL